MSVKTLDERRRAFYDVAEAIAPTWERRRDHVEQTAAPVREWMVRELRPKTGDTVLELAAGVGETGFEIARIVGETGLLISTDWSPAMLDAARRRGRALGIANVEYHVFDAERIELDDDSVDGVVCRFGYMLMADPAAALAETRRVLRPGGRVTLAVWGAPERNPFLGIVGLSLVRRGCLPAPEPPPAPGPFALASPERTEQLLRAAGFAEVRSEEVPVRFGVLPDVNEYLSVIADTAGPVGLALRGLDEPERRAVELEVESSLSPFVVEGGYELPGVALCAVAS
jgi:ubiquinone/menaquinone biosynthesis C-methylase UbiE